MIKVQQCPGAAYIIECVLTQKRLHGKRTEKRENITSDWGLLKSLLTPQCLREGALDRWIETSTFYKSISSMADWKKMKHGWGSVMFCSCCVVFVTRCPESVQGTVKSEDYTAFFRETYCPVWKSSVSVAGHGSSERIISQNIHLINGKIDVSEVAATVWALI